MEERLEMEQEVYCNICLTDDEILNYNKQWIVRDKIRSYIRR